MTSKLSIGNGVLYKLRQFIPQNILVNLYYSYLQSYLNYSLLNWSSTSSANLECLRVKTKASIRIITFSKKNEHTAPLFKQLKILSLDKLIEFNQAIFMWKMSNNYIPQPLRDKFIKRPNNNSFFTPPPEREYEKLDISYSCPKIWKSLPNKLKNIRFLNTFKIQMKLKLLNEVDNNIFTK